MTSMTCKMLSATALMWLCACGQRSDFSERYDPSEDERDTSQREERASTPQSDPSPQPDPTPQPEPTPMKGYATDERGFPVARHEGSFKEIVHSSEQACAIDEFEDLYCWPIEFDQDQPPRPPSFIEPVYEGVAEVALGEDTLCVLESGRYGAYCADSEGSWHILFASRLTFADLSVTANGAYVCAFQEQRGLVWCARLSIYPSQQDLEFVNHDVWFEPERGQAYTSFDMANMNLSRGEYFAALNTEGIIEYYEGSGSEWFVQVDIKSDTSDDPFIAAYNDYGYVVGLTRSGEVKRYNMSYSIDQGPYTVLSAPDLRFTALYSTSCGRVDDGRVVCWTRNDRLDPEEPLPTWTIYKDPVSISIRTSYTWCAISRRGQIECGWVKP